MVRACRARPRPWGAALCTVALTAALAMALPGGDARAAAAEAAARATTPVPRGEVAETAVDSPARRPRVGLVLGGGGARGAAHIGVLEVLERLRVPIACVAGTSMGALVAGAWAAGLSPEQMRAALARTDWADMFQDNPDYIDLNFRNKRLQQRFLAGSEAGISLGGAVGPPGVVTGQKIKLFLNQLVHADSGEREIQDLPLPVSIIATDIGNGERVVFREGSLTQAMRASMSVPGLMAPLETPERKLVDGGLVDNLPVREVRERCAAEVVIAVNVGSPLLKPEEVGGLLSISAQVVALLTEQNVSASLALLRPADIYIKPDLGDIGASDFVRHAGAAERGRVAAEQAAAQLAALSVPAADYAAWRQSLVQAAPVAQPVDEVEIVGLERVNPEVVRRYLQQRPGAPLNTAQLNRDLLRAYGDGHYERVDYSLVRLRERQLLRVMPVEKSWGPDYLRLALQLDTTLSQGSSYQLRLGYQKTWLNTLGGELLLTADLGNRTGVAAEFYQPLDARQRFFANALADYRRERSDYFDLDQRVAEYRSARSRLELTAGINFDLLGQLRLGWRQTRVSNTLETGLDVLAQVPERSAGGWLLSVDLDRLDRLYFPRRGWAAQASWFDSPQRGYSRFSLDARGAVPAGPFVFGTRLSWVESPRGQLPLVDAGKLGGFLNLSGYASGQLVGDSVAYMHLRAERIIGSLPLGLRGDMRIGVALEAGRVGQPYTRQVRNGWLNSAVVYLGGETPIGPVYLGLGQSGGGSTNAYLFIGTP